MSFWNFLNLYFYIFYQSWKNSQIFSLQILLLYYSLFPPFLSLNYTNNILIYSDQYTLCVFFLHMIIFTFCILFRLYSIFYIEVKPGKQSCFYVPPFFFPSMIPQSWHENLTAFISLNFLFLPRIIRLLKALLVSQLLNCFLCLASWPLVWN